MVRHVAVVYLGNGMEGASCSMILLRHFCSRVVVAVGRTRCVD